jgi:folylpolyglutamate synthase/dihydropteroate synthase
MALQVLEEQAAGVGFHGTVEAVPVVGEALRRACALTGPDGVVVVTGSLFIIGEARDCLGLPAGQAVNYDPALLERLLLE